MEENFVFQFASIDQDTLTPQVSQALEVRTELISRVDRPNLWAVTDRLNRTKKAPAEFQARHRRKGAYPEVHQLGFGRADPPGAFLPEGEHAACSGGTLCFGTRVYEHQLLSHSYSEIYFTIQTKFFHHL